MNDTEKLARIKEIAQDYLDIDTHALHRILNVIDGDRIVKRALVGSEYLFVVGVMGCTKEEADTVMTERIDPDEDYGFTYAIDWRPI